MRLIAALLLGVTAGLLTWAVVPDADPTCVVVKSSRGDEPLELTIRCRDDATKADIAEWIDDHLGGQLPHVDE